VNQNHYGPGSAVTDKDICVRGAVDDLLVKARGQRGLGVDGESAEEEEQRGEKGSYHYSPCKVFPFINFDKAAKRRLIHSKSGRTILGYAAWF
jgi:hypothetical protein